ncbi:4Fe-4S dicluster domain-containing protein [Desulfurispira natronophila]|uniref:Ferredoxin n=1 Tax=Desulfurispira natronophila TaxID=682562 RepID=A0A7W7Y3B5_9BACT|nr:4Fe-4S dicluster domain-containing protein [Desulfurispira natronophila]MBB5021306.1 ferredoxin [Desulfurispira natronophila]
MIDPHQIYDVVNRISTTLRINTSRCLRQRFYRNNCYDCARVCPEKVITLEPGLDIDHQGCSECMLCVATCPTEALEPKFTEFHLIMEKLAHLQKPVLGCSMFPEQSVNARTYCLGGLSHEHLLALSYLVPTQVQLNLTACRDCKLATSGMQVEQRLWDLERHIDTNLSRHLRAVTKESELEFVAEAIGRRNIVGFLRRKATVETARMFHQLNTGGEYQTSYGVKQLPYKRHLLNEVWKNTESVQSSLSCLLYYHLRIADNCTLCSACSAICPSGALELAESDLDTGKPKRLLFMPFRCTGCCLCVEFCPVRAMSLTTGFNGELFAKHRIFQALE